MIVVKHTDGIVLEVIHNDTSLGPFNTSLASEVMFALSAQYEAEILVWCEAEVFELLDIDRIPSLLPTGLEMISFGDNYLPEAIAYVEDSPFISVSRNSRYPTWMMSPTAGAVMTDTIKRVNGDLLHKNFAYFLNSMAKAGQRKGLLCYSEPKLLKGRFEPGRNPIGGKNSLFSFVKQHYKAQWLGVLMLSYLVFEKKFPLFPWYRSMFKSRKTEGFGDIPQLPAGNYEADDPAIDVLIPTLGRPDFLKLVLEDLAKQELLPRKVIVIEQTADPNGDSLLTYLEDNWPFEIHHQHVYPPGACKARNIGLGVSDSQWVFLADDDIRIPRDFLQNAIEFLLTYKAEAATFSCLQEGEKEMADQVLQWNSFGSGCSIVSSAAIDKIRFDEHMEHGYGEDKEFGMQLRKSGVDVLYAPHIRLLHLKAPSGGFRNPVPKPWESAEVLPKPSPTIMYYLQKHFSTTQRNGYKLRLFLKFYKQQKTRNIFSYFRRFKAGWNSSIHWSEKLKSGS